MKVVEHLNIPYENDHIDWYLKKKKRAGNSTSQIFLLVTVAQVIPYQLNP